MPVQSEAALENGLIDTLQKMNYEYVHIEEEKNLYEAVAGTRTALVSAGGICQGGGGTFSGIPDQ